MSEADEQKAVVEWCEWKRIPVYHIPNEAQRSPRTAAHLKKMGMRPGVPDLCIPVARGGKHGLYVEMKAGRNKPSDSQLRWLSILEEQGYEATVCWGADEAIAAIEAYMAAGVTRSA